MSCCEGGSCGIGANKSPGTSASAENTISMPTSLGNEVLFDNFVRAAGSSIVAIDMTASWCGPCKTMKPVFNNLAGAAPDVKFGIVDIDSNQAVAQRYNVTSVPTFLFLRNGILIDRFTGGDPMGLQTTLNNVQLHAFDVIQNGCRVRLRGLKAASKLCQRFIIDTLCAVVLSDI